MAVRLWLGFGDGLSSVHFLASKQRRMFQFGFEVKGAVPVGLLLFLEYVCTPSMTCDFASYSKQNVKCSTAAGV